MSDARLAQFKARNLAPADLVRETGLRAWERGNAGHMVTCDGAANCTPAIYIRIPVQRPARPAYLLGDASRSWVFLAQWGGLLRKAGRVGNPGLEQVSTPTPGSGSGPGLGITSRSTFPAKGARLASCVASCVRPCVCSARRASCVFLEPDPSLLSLRTVGSQLGFSGRQVVNFSGI